MDRLTASRLKSFQDREIEWEQKDFYSILSREFQQLQFSAPVVLFYYYCSTNLPYVALT
jgi:hypothetical protein